MIKNLRDFWDRVRTRRKLKRKGVIISRRRFDSEKIFSVLEGTPAPAIFTLIMIWAVVAVLLTISARRHEDSVLNLIIGQRAPRTIVATVDFSYQDTEGTELEIRQALETIPLYFRIDAKRNNAIRRDFGAFFEATETRLADERQKRAFSPTHGDRVAQFVKEMPQPLMEPLGDFLRSATGYKEFDRNLSRTLARGILDRERRDSLKMSQTLRIIDPEQRTGPVKNATEQDDPQSVAATLAAEILTVSGSNEQLRAPLAKILLELIGKSGNLITDEKLYQEKLQEAADQIKPVMMAVSKGDLLVRRDQEVTPEISHILNAYETVERGTIKLEKEISTLIHNSLRSLLLVLLSAFYLYHLHSEVVRRNKLLLVLGSIVILSLLVNFAALHFFGFIMMRGVPIELAVLGIPITLGSVLLATIMGYRIGLCAGFFISAATAMMLLPEHAFDLAIKGLVICSLATLTVRSATNYRSYFVRILFTVFPLIILFNLDLLNYHSPNFILLLIQAATVAFANAVITAILALILIFILEIGLNASTNMALMVLCDYNHPLLERMKREAPGTFFHSLMVATLAEDAARAIDANALKAKAGALFHDIGKLSMPQYFTENNLDSANQHLDLNPQMSSIIIRDHVKEGLILAKHYRLCQTVRDAIRQHHGNDLIRFFYQKALEEQQGGNSAPVLESQFRYDGIPPQDKEMAIISLADACEAACRSLDKPSASKIEAVVDSIFRCRFEGHQLNRANITLAELETVRQSFINTLVSMKHGRIAYQTEKRRDYYEQRLGNPPPAPAEEKGAGPTR